MNRYFLVLILTVTEIKFLNHDLTRCIALSFIFIHNYFISIFFNANPVFLIAITPFVFNSKQAILSLNYTKNVIYLIWSSQVIELTWVEVFIILKFFLALHNLFTLSKHYIIVVLLISILNRRSVKRYLKI